MKQLIEIRRVLKYPRFKFSEEQINRFHAIISEVSTIIETEKEINVVRDPTDNMLIEAAIESNTKYIITGDDDLLSLKEYRGIKILTVSDFLEEENKKG
ncbi:MAG: putative toxin-antitoxin system toxin component, PIN family [Nanoarchaeota archaeon]